MLLKIGQASLLLNDDWATDNERSALRSSFVAQPQFFSQPFAVRCVLVDAFHRANLIGSHFLPMTEGTKMKMWSFVTNRSTLSFRSAIVNLRGGLRRNGEEQ
jgi:hypothetical protein